MKLIKCSLSMALVAGMLWSCSSETSENIVPDTDQTTASTKTFTAVFTVQLPSVSSRAIDEGDFDDPTDNEGKVENLQFFIYKKADNGEDNYTCVGSSSVIYPGTSSGTSSDIESTATVTVQFDATENVTISGNQSSGNYFGLCVVNVHDGFSVPTVSSTSPQKFGDWKKTVLTLGESTNPFIYGESGSERFTMTNAPTFTGSTPSNITTLVALDDSKFKEAPSVPGSDESAGTFYVQRGVAKVKVGASDSKDLTKLTSSINENHEFELESWKLDITNKKSYPVQVVSKDATNLTWDKTWSYTSTSSNIDFNHLWWGIDPNYNYGDFTDVSDHFNTIETKDITNTSTDVEYCLENTMNYDQMIQNQTTRVIVKGKYKLNKENEAESFVVNPINNVVVSVKDKTIESVSAGQHKLNEVVNSSDLAEIAKSLSLDEAGEGMVDFYPDGETYYVVRIYHFDPDNEAKLDVNSKVTVTEGKASYAEDHLGRYGVLRNNIYSININGVGGFGSPIIPEAGEEPNDDPEVKKYNMLIEIKVLKWAKRSHDYTLK